MKIVCDPAAASEAMDTIDQRHEALMGHLWMAIRNGIEAHNTLEQSHGFARGTPAEFEKAFAALIVDLVGFDRRGPGSMCTAHRASPTLSSIPLSHER